MKKQYEVKNAVISPEEYEVLCKLLVLDKPVTVIELSKEMNHKFSDARFYDLLYSMKDCELVLLDEKEVDVHGTKLKRRFWTAAADIPKTQIV